MTPIRFEDSLEPKMTESPGPDFAERSVASPERVLWYFAITGLRAIEHPHLSYIELVNTTIIIAGASPSSAVQAEGAGQRVSCAENRARILSFLK